MRQLLYLFSLLLVLASCSTGDTTQQAKDGTTETTPTRTVDKTTLKGEIDELEAFFKSNGDKPLNKTKAALFVEKSELYASSFPKDEMSPAFLFRAGEVSRAIKQYREGILILDKVYTDYPDHEKAAPALFLKAFTYEENLRDKEQAKQYYNEFLQKFPDHQLASQVQQLLSVIDQSPEDLIKSFQKNK